MDPQNVLTIIPARGGSKGIPRKNVKLIAGRPLLAHSIVHAKQAPSVTRVVVSTDDEEVASVSREWGAEVVPRPQEISGDSASSESALRHALDCLKEREGYEPELVVFLQATSPCRAPGEIQRAIDTLIKDGADSLLSVGPLHGFVWRVEKDGTARSFSYDHLNRPRRQDAPEDLVENGSFYIFKPWVLRKFNNRLGGRIALHRMTALDSFQIDEPGDFELLEHLMAFRKAASGLGFEVSGFESRPQVSGLQSQPSPPSPISHLLFSIRPSPISNLLSSIRLLVLDFDGVLTDNRVLVTEDGKEAVLCNRSDGLGLEMLRAKGIGVLVLSKEKNPVVAARCRKLGIGCIQGCDHKLAALRKMAEDRNLKPEEIGYAGNDLNDLECLRWVGLPIAVRDAAPEVLAIAKWVTTSAGGRGAVREVCDAILAAKRDCDEL